MYEDLDGFTEGLAKKFVFTKVVIVGIFDAADIFGIDQSLLHRILFDSLGILCS